MKWPQRGWIKKGVRSLWWKTQNFTPRRLRMGSVFGYEWVSFGESPKTVHCVIACKHLHHGCIWKKDLYYLSSVCLNILFKTKMTHLFYKFRIVDMLDIWLNKENDNFDWFKMTPQVLATVVNLVLHVLLLLVTMVQEVELMMNVIMQEIFGNINKVNIQLANLPMKMISHTTHKMKAMDLDELVQA